MNKAPGQNVLSAYFNREHRHLPGVLGHSARAAWLDAHFGGLETIQNGSKYVSALPCMYFLQPDMKSHIGLILTHLMGPSDNNTYDNVRRARFIPLRLEMTSDSLKESVGKLHKTVIKLSLYDELRRHQPKDGQDPEMLVSGQSYAMVHRGDPLHDHSSLDLIDFSAPVVTPWVQRVRMREFEGFHSHLLNPKCE